MNRGGFSKILIVLTAILASSLYLAKNANAEGNVSQDTSNFAAGCSLDDQTYPVVGHSGLVSTPGAACSVQGYAFAKIKYTDAMSGTTPLLMTNGNTNTSLSLEADCAEKSDSFFIFGSLKYSYGDTYAYYGADNSVRTSSNYDYMIKSNGVSVGGINSPYADEWVAGMHYGNKTALFILGNDSAGDAVVRGNADPLSQTALNSYYWYNGSKYYNHPDYIAANKWSHDHGLRNFTSTNSPLQIYKKINGVDVLVMYLSDILIPSGTGAGNENAMMKDLGLMNGNSMPVYWGGGTFGFTAPGATNGSPAGEGHVVSGVVNLPGFYYNNNGTWNNPYVITDSSVSNSEHDRDLYNELIKGYQRASYESGAPRTPRPGVCAWDGIDPANPSVKFDDNLEDIHLSNSNNGATQRATITVVPGQSKTLKFTHILTREGDSTSSITLNGTAILDGTSTPFSGTVSGSNITVTKTTMTISSLAVNTSKEYCASTKTGSKTSGQICVTVKCVPVVTEISPQSTIRNSSGRKMSVKDGCPEGVSDYGAGIYTGSWDCPYIIPDDGKVVFTTTYNAIKPNPYDASGEKYGVHQVYPSTDTSIKFKIKHGFQVFVADRGADRYNIYNNLYGNYGGNLTTRILNWGYAKPSSSFQYYNIGQLGLDVEWLNQGLSTNKITETLVTRDVKYGDRIRVKHNPSTSKYVFTVSNTGNKYEEGKKTQESGFDVYLYKDRVGCFWHNFYFGTSRSYGIDSAHNYGGIYYIDRTTRQSVSVDGEINTYGAAWAKPADEILFTNVACAGSNYAVDNSDKLSGYTGKRANYSLSTTTSNGGSSRAWTRRITNNNPASYLNGDEYDTGVNTPLNSSLNLKCYGKGGDGKYAITSGYAAVSNTRCNAISNMDLGGSFTETMTWKDYPIENYNMTNANGINKSASVEVKVPYNYVIEPTVEPIGSDDMIYPDGSSKQFKIDINVNGRKNEAVDNSAYATTTKHTKVQVITYKLDSTVANYTIDTKYSGMSTSYVQTNDLRGTVRDRYNINNNYTFVSQYELQGENTGETSRVFHKLSGSASEGVAADNIPNYAFSIVRNDGTGASANNAKYNNLAYDEGVEFNTGDKICVVVAAYPADSHNIGAGDVYGYDQYVALSGDNGDGTTDGYWAISKPSCGTTGKRPNMSVESSWLYSTSDVKGTITSRSAGARYYGSWAEYGIISTGSSAVVDFASSASIAYQPGIHPNNANDHIAGSDGGGTKTSTTIGTRLCDNTELLTISSDCNTNLYNSASDLKPKLTSKINRSYTSLKSSIDSRFELGTVTSHSSDYTYNGSNNGLRLLNASTDVTYDAGKRSAVLKGDKTITLGTGGSLSFDGDLKTIVIKAKDVVINSDIIVNNGTMTAAGDARAVIIIATRSIKIASNVTRIDAWLLTDGEINTCYSDGGRAINDVKDLALDVCNQTLVVDAPVYAGSMKLFRTAGGSGAVSGSGGVAADEQMKRAEVFNFNTVNYFWAQTDVPATETITTTDIKELPVRY